MSELIDRLVANPTGVFGKGGGIALCCEVRLARNIAGRKFPANCSPEEKNELCAMAAAALAGFDLPGSAKVLFAKLDDLEENDRAILAERRLVSPSFVTESAGRAVAVSPDERWSLAVNGVDALELRVFRPGAAFGEAWAEASALDDEFNRGFNYAYDEHLGFLTSRFDDVGTAMRASVLLHLPGIALSGQSSAVISSLNDEGLELRGIGGGSDKPPLFFRLGNKHTLGESEVQAVDRLEAAYSRLAEREMQTRKALFIREQHPMLDLIGRSYGVLRHAHRLSFEEAEKCLSGVRLGVETKLFKGLDSADLNALQLSIGPAHLRKRAGRALNPEEEAVCRASLCRAGI